MSATEPNSNVLKFPVCDRNEVEFCVPDGITDAENLLPIILHDDANGYAATGRGGKVLVHEGVRGNNGERHAVRLPDGKIVVRRLVRISVGRLRLEAVNPSYESLEFFESQIEVIGMVVRNRLDCATCQGVPSKEHESRQSNFLDVEMVNALERVISHVRSTPCVPTHIWSAPVAEIATPISRPVMTWQMDSKGVVKRADPLCRQFFGLANEEMRAGLWKNRIHPDDRTNYLRSRERALAENTIYENTVRVLDARDEYCLIAVVILPIWDDDGEFVKGWQAVAKLAEGLIKRSA